MWVKSYMFTSVCTANSDMTIEEAVKFMVEHKTNSLIVVDEEQRPIGTLSSYTLIKSVVPAYLKDDPMFSQFGREGTFDKYAEKVKNKQVKEMMHTNFHTLSEDDTMIEAASYSIKAARRILPVVDSDGKLKGAITRNCIKNALYNVLYKQKQIDPENGGCCKCAKH